MDKRYGITDERKISTKLISLSEFQSRTLFLWKLCPGVETGHKDAGERLDARCPSATLGALLLVSFHTFPKGARRRLGNA